MMKFWMVVMLLMVNGYRRGEYVKDMTKNNYPIYVPSAIITP